MNELSAKQKQILEYMKQEVREKGYPPSVREICEAVGLKSTSTVHGHLSRLEKKGLIQRLSVEEDARLKRIILTPQAKSLHREVEMAVVRMEKIALRGLSKAEIEVFWEILEKMKANLQEDMLTYDEQKGE